MLALVVRDLLKSTRSPGQLALATTCLESLVDGAILGSKRLGSDPALNSLPVASRTGRPADFLLGARIPEEKARYEGYAPQGARSLHTTASLAGPALPDALPWDEATGDGTAPVPKPPLQELADPDAMWRDKPAATAKQMQRYERHRMRPHRFEGTGPEVDPDAPLSDDDRRMLAALQRYKAVYGDCGVPRQYWEDPALGIWCSTMRKNAKAPRRMKTAMKAELDRLGFPWKLPMEDAEWDFNLHELRRYRVEFGHGDVPFKWRDPTYDFSNHFAKWFHAQPTLFQQRRLSLLQVEKLKIAGLDVRATARDVVDDEEYSKSHGEVEKLASQAEFDVMFAELKKWHELYRTCMVPKQVWDNPVLGLWVHRVRRDHKNGRLPSWQQSALEGLGFDWKVHQQVAKWHFNLHEARRWKEVHGHGMLPAGYANKEERNWVEAARWLHRQARLFGKGRLSENNEGLIRDILGVKFQRHVTGKTGGSTKTTRGKIRQSDDSTPTGPATMPLGSDTLQVPDVRQGPDARVLGKKQKRLIALHKREMKLRALGRK